MGAGGIDRRGGIIRAENEIFTMFRGVGLDLAMVPPLHGRRSRGANGGKIGHSGRDDRKRRGGWREPAPLKNHKDAAPGDDRREKQEGHELSCPYDG